MKSPKVSYDFYRLGFRADVIEPLGDRDVFRVVTPDGAFQMSKSEFYRVFANVVASASYREGGLYHYPVVPGKANVFRVG